jgi:protein LSM14
LVGSLLQLITNAQVRYEGTLVEVDKTERSMKLKDVRSYGTEGRRGGVNEVDPSE